MATSPLHLRDAAPEDAPALGELKLATFRETFLEGFGIGYPPDDLALFEAQTYGPARIASELADPLHRTWVIDAANGPAGRLMGYAHVGPCKLPHPDVGEGHLELYQLYLRREAQGSGLGRRLLDQALDHMRPRGHPIWLGVWSGNERALAVYAARGFKVVGEYQFRVGTWLDDEFIMRLDPEPA